MLLKDIHPKIFLEGTQDKTFGIEIVATLRSGLGSKYSDVREGMVKVFTAALAQGVLH